MYQFLRGGFPVKPSHENTCTGLLRGLDEDIQQLRCFKTLSNYKKVDDYTDVSSLQGFTLEQYIATREKLCQAEHNQHCKPCAGLLNVGKHIAKNGFIKLNDAFRMTSPELKY